MDEILRCVSNTFPRISYHHSDYEELRNFQIPDQNTNDSEVSVSSNNGSISTEPINIVRSLETDWESHVNRKKSGWGSNTNLNINSGWETNIT